MKRLITSILISIMILPSFALAGAERKVCVECTLKANAAQIDKIIRTCNDVSDIICKDVKAEDRRGCSEADEYMFSKNTTKNDIFNFAKGCFKSSVTSFTQFFTDFIPELLKGVWEATKTVGSLAVKSVSGDEPGLWSKFKGMYESTTSVAADIYEAVQENPGAYFDKIWSKIVDVVGPMVANYDCLKPQKKVENICGFVAEWLVPPAVLAKVLVHGIKEVKFMQKAGVFSMASSGKLAKALEFSEKRSMFTLKQLQEMEKGMTSLGYTRDEFALLYKSGALEKVKIADLKSLSTAQGKAQRLELFGEKKAAGKSVAKAAPKKPAAPVAPKHVELNLSSDFITIPGKAGHSAKSGQIIERFIEDGKEAGYRIRMLDDAGNVIEMKMTNIQLAKLHPSNATAEVAEKMAAVLKKDDKYLSPEAEFKALQKEHEAAIAKAALEARVRPVKIDGMDVLESDFSEFEKLSAAQQAAHKSETASAVIRAKNEEKRAQVLALETMTPDEKWAAAKNMAEGKKLDMTVGKPKKLDGVDVHDSDFIEYEKLVADQNSASVKAALEKETKAKADYMADQQRIKAQGIVKHDGMVLEELAHDDPRYIEMFGTPAEKAALNPKYVGGIDYVPVNPPGQIIRNSNRMTTPVKPIKAAADAEKAIGPYTTNYIQVMAKNSMGMTSFMPAQIVRKVMSENQVKYVVRMLDKASNSYKEVTVSATELKLQMKAKEMPKVERELKDFNRQTGFQGEL